MLRSDEIAFRVSDPSLSAEVATKATAVTSLSSFNVSAVTGSAGSETAVWTNQTFMGNNEDGYKYAFGGKWWPATNDSPYRFYASNSPLSFSTTGATVGASYGQDVVCAYAAAPTYKSKNTLTFEHIFARLGRVTVTAASGYSISNVSIKLTLKTNGTYNLLTGAGQSDGTGWSSIIEASEANTIASAIGSNENDYLTVPGTYTLTASWIATRGAYTENIENMQVDVALTAGKINTISTTLSGNAKEVVFNVNIAPWTEQNQVVEFPTKPSFGGQYIAEGNLYYDGTEFKIADGWNYDSFNNEYGLTEGSYYFNFVEIGKRFSSQGESFAAGNVSIDNENPLTIDAKDWRVPTMEDWINIIRGERVGATVNGNANIKCAIVQLSGVTHAGNDTPFGVLLFPDNVIITGTDLNLTPELSMGTEGPYTIYTYTPGTTLGITESQLNQYLAQGCVFLADSGYRNGTGWHRHLKTVGNSSEDVTGNYMTATVTNSQARTLRFTSENVIVGQTNIIYSEANTFKPVRLVR